MAPSWMVDIAKVYKIDFRDGKGLKFEQSNCLARCKLYSKEKRVETVAPVEVHCVNQENCHLGICSHIGSYLWAPVQTALWSSSPLALGHDLGSICLEACLLNIQELPLILADLGQAALGLSITLGSKANGQQCMTTRHHCEWVIQGFEHIRWRSYITEVVKPWSLLNER